MRDVLLSYSFDKKHLKENAIEDLEIPNLFSGIIYCPKCGNVNSYEDDLMALMKNCFCERCGTRLNDFWEKYKEEELVLINCEFCAKATFLNQKFCVQCGTKQQKVSSERLKQLQKPSNRIDLLDHTMRLFTADSDDKIMTEVKNKIVVIIVITVILFAIIVSVILMMNFIGKL